MKRSIIGPDQTCFQVAFAQHEMHYCLELVLEQIARASAREWNRQTQQLWQDVQTL